VHLVGFVIRIYHDAQSSDCHILLLILHSGTSNLYQFSEDVSCLNTCLNFLTSTMKELSFETIKDKCHKRYSN